MGEQLSYDANWHSCRTLAYCRTSTLTEVSFRNVRSSALQSVWSLIVKFLSRPQSGS